MFEFLVDLVKGIGSGYLNLFLGLFVGGGICLGIYALYVKVFEWFEENDTEHGWLTYFIVPIIIGSIVWLLENFF